LDTDEDGNPFLARRDREGGVIVDEPDHRVRMQFLETSTVPRHSTRGDVKGDYGEGREVRKGPPRALSEDLHASLSKPSFKEVPKGKFAALETRGHRGAGEEHPKGARSLSHDPLRLHSRPTSPNGEGKPTVIAGE
jgi:hypothetical protein